MKAFTEKFGQVEITEKSESSVIVILKDGTKKRLMPRFVKLFDETGNEITDFSSVKDELDYSKYSGKSTTGRKTSKLAEMKGTWMERNGYSKYNFLTKKYE